MDGLHKLAFSKIAQFPFAIACTKTESTHSNFDWIPFSVCKRASSDVLRSDGFNERTKSQRRACL